MPIHGNPEWQCFFAFFLRFSSKSSKLLQSPRKNFSFFLLYPTGMCDILLYAKLWCALHRRAAERHPKRIRFSFLPCFFHHQAGHPGRWYSPCLPESKWGSCLPEKQRGHSGASLSGTNFPRERASRIHQKEGKHIVQEQKNGSDTAHNSHSHQHDGVRHHPSAVETGGNRHRVHFRLDPRVPRRDPPRLRLLRMRHVRKEERRHGRLRGVPLRQSGQFPVQLHLRHLPHHRQYRHRNGRRQLRIVLLRV